MNEITELIKHLRQGHTPWTKIDELLNLPPDGARNKARSQEWYKQIAQSNPHDKSDDVDKKSYKEDGSISSFIRTRLDSKQTFSQRELLELHGLDPIEFKVKTITSNEWSMTAGAGDRYYNFQSKVLAEPVESKDIDWDKLADKLVSKVEPREPKPFNLNHSDEYLTIPLFDLHFGNNKLEDYDESLGKLLNLIDNEYIKILIIAGGDLLHNDNHRGMTARGTVIDKVDMEQAWDDAFDMLDMVIAKSLDSAESVEIMYVPGNHDEFAGQTVFKALEKVYRKEERLVIDNEQVMFKAKLLGHNFIGASHGDKSQKNRYPMIYASNFSKLWGEDGVRTREVFVGHLHFESVIDKDGLLIRQAPTRNKTDQWHADNGYMTSHKRFNVVVYDEYEPVCVHYF